MRRQSKSRCCARLLDSRTGHTLQSTSEQESALAMAQKLASSSIVATRCRFGDPGGRPRLSRSRGEGGCEDSGLPGTKSAARHDEASGWLGSWWVEEETAPGHMVPFSLRHRRVDDHCFHGRPPLCVGPTGTSFPAVMCAVHLKPRILHRVPLHSRPAHNVNTPSKPSD